MIPRSLVIIGAAALAVAGIFLLLFLSAGAGDRPTPLALPKARQQADAGFPIAELYQAIHRDIASGAYDQAGILIDSAWTFDEATEICSTAVTLATQQGIERFAPTPTLPLDQVAIYSHATRTVQETIGETTVTKTVHVVDEVRTSNVRPTPGKFDRPPVQVDSVAWIGWEGRPVAIEVDGVAILETPKNTRIDAYLTVLAGNVPDVSNQAELARLPLPAAEWDAGLATLDLQAASGRVLLASDAIPTFNRSAALTLSVRPVSDCSTLNLRWQRPAVVVLLARTEQPYRDWSASQAVPPVQQQPPGQQPPPQVSAQIVYLGGNDTESFAVGDFTVQAFGAPPLRLTLPANAGAVVCAAPNRTQNCRHVGIAVPASVTVTSVQRAGLFYQEWCGILIEDCTSTTPITIAGNPYKYLEAGPFYALADVDLVLNWTN